MTTEMTQKYEVYEIVTQSGSFYGIEIGPFRSWFCGMGHDLQADTASAPVVGERYTFIDKPSGQRVYTSVVTEVDHITEAGF